MTTPTGDTLRGRVGALRHTARVRSLLTVARLAVAVLRDLPALNDLPELLPELTARVYRLAGLRDVDVHEWLCDVGLCPCGVELDPGELEAGAALAVAV